MQMMANNLTIKNARFTDNWTFSNGITVPVYEVHSSHALNQLIGYAKFKNRDYGNVYYRGQTNIYSTLLSSLHRNYKQTQSAGRIVGKIIKKIESDNRLIKDLKLERLNDAEKRVVIECMLQHYGIKTRYLDLVDNHWVALWMGLHSFTTIKQVMMYAHYVKREIPYINLINGTAKEEDFFQYILLLAFPYNTMRTPDGGCRVGTFPNRSGCTSTYLQPCYIR